MLTLFGVIGIPGNLLVVVVNWKAKKMSNTNLLIFTMAIVDFIGALTAILNVIKVQLWFQILDIKFCKFVTMLTYSVNTPAIYLVFGVSVVRYYHVCKPHLIYSIHKKIKPFCICVLILTLVVAVVYGVCAEEAPWEYEDVPGFKCDISETPNCRLATSIGLIFVVLSYIFCLNGLIGLNFRILQKLFQQRKIMSRYKIARRKSKNVKRKSKTEIIPVTTESHLTSINNFDDKIDYTVSLKGDSIQDSISNKCKSSKNEDNESYDVILKLEENFIEHQTHPKRKSSKIKGKSESIEINMEKELREENSFKSGRISVERMSVKNNDSVKNKILNDNKTKEKKLGNELEKCCYWKRCLPRVNSLFKLEGYNRTTLKLAFVSIAYLVIYTPWFVVAINMLIDPIYEETNPDLTKYVLIPVYTLPFAGCALNPVIYAFVDPKFRSQCKALFQ